MEPLEIEVKFFLTDPVSIREKIKKMGAKSKGRIFEKNIRFEDQKKSLLSKNALLRLRKDNRYRLTYKCEPREKDNHYKIYRELETEVGDFSTMKKILEALGYHKEQVYEKWRETFLIEETQICIDQMPFGDFMEIEGGKKEIRNLAKEIGLRWDQRILQNYLKIFDIIRKRENLPFSDVTFDNFKKNPVRFSDYVGLFIR